MSNDWSWTFSSEYGRDRMLRDRLDDLEHMSASSRASESRLRAQLQRTQGSLETRLKALSRAFDAYVELGDVREQLRGFTGTAEIRRCALRAVEALGQGRRPAPLPEDQTYWLVPALQGVVARFDGHADPEAEARAVELDRDAETFMVATLGMLGQGAAVAGRVPALLVTDTGLTVEQQALWSAVLDDVYGSATLAAVRASLTPALGLDQSGHDLWRRWLLDATPGNDRLDELTWLHQQLTAHTPDPPEPPGETALSVTGVDRLKAVAARMIAEGRADERDLLARAEVLRSVIESPSAAVPDADERERAEELAVPSAVQQAIAAATVGSSIRRELLSWLAPVLVGVVDQVAASAIAGPVSIAASTPGGQLEVRATGADPAVVQRVKSAAAATAPDNVKRVGLTGLATVLVVAAVSLFIAGQTAGGVVLLVGAAIAGLAAALAWRDAKVQQSRRAADVAEVDRAITVATERAVSLDRANAQYADRVRSVHATLTAVLKTHLDVHAPPPDVHAPPPGRARAAPGRARAAPGRARAAPGRARRRPGLSTDRPRRLWFRAGDGAVMVS